MMVPTPMAVAVDAVIVHGLETANPRPAPSSRRMKEIAAAVTAPAMIAGQLTADAGPDSSVPTGTTTVVSTMTALRLVPEQREDDDDRNRYPKKPKQNAATHAHDCFSSR